MTLCLGLHGPTHALLYLSYLFAILYQWWVRDNQAISVRHCIKLPCKSPKLACVFQLHCLRPMNTSILCAWHAGWSIKAIECILLLRLAPVHVNGGACIYNMMIIPILESTCHMHINVGMSVFSSIGTVIINIPCTSVSAQVSSSGSNHKAVNIRPLERTLGMASCARDWVWCYLAKWVVTTNLFCQSSSIDWHWYSSSVQ